MRSMDQGPLNSELWRELYAFAFALVGEELSACEIVKEAITHFFREDQELIEKPKSAKRSGLMSQSLYRWCYRTAKNSSFTQTNNSPFFRLSMKERAHLYLREMSGFDRFEREFITETSFEDLVSTTHEAKNKLLALFGVGPYV